MRGFRHIAVCDWCDQVRTASVAAGVWVAQHPPATAGVLRKGIAPHTCIQPHIRSITPLMNFIVSLKKGSSPTKPFFLLSEDSLIDFPIVLLLTASFRSVSVASRGFSRRSLLVLPLNLKGIE